MLMLEIIGFGILFVILLFLAARCCGRSLGSAGVKITRPDPKRVDRFGGTRAHDFSYVGANPDGYPKPLPVNLRREREKTET